MESPSFWEFSVRLLRQTRGFSLWDRFLKYFRRFRFITTAFRFAPWILLAIQTNTLLYVLSVAAVLMTPLVLLGILSLFGTAAIRHHGANRENITKNLRGQTVYVLFPLRGEEFLHGGFWRANAKDLCERDNCTVLVVSPYLLASHGVFNTSFYRTVKEELPRLLLIRRQCFFFLQNHLLPYVAERVILLY